ncbi:exodeoxyribonuclease I [Isoalcanivorax indicus]|uniref:exodeoxyribonuclease I n=1 Tax=Isoalcanivorax indicus TaxID=2202653 RepID=UPI000DBA559E|nr:exodeoxyribonuclease I [Isoalcanivorax indicus]
MTEQTFYWHDYETWGANPAVDRPSQFAGVRTDADLNIIGEPLMLYSRPSPDYLPHPEACLITGITPQQALEEGVPEAEFIARIHAELAKPGTCAVGYNSIRFDDEVTRHTLYRNFFDPYAREWQNGNSRWDLIDVVRLCHAVRPDGIRWPQREDGTPSFKLERLTAENGLAHEAAHDALSDVTATIALARLIRERQPKLFEYALSMRFKHEVSKQLNVISQLPVLYVAGHIPAARFCAAIMMPLALHPTNRNSVLCYDLSEDPADLISLDADAIRARVFASARELGDTPRIPLREIQVNRSPMVATVKLVDESVAARLDIDMATCRRHWQQLRDAGDLTPKLHQIYAQREFAESADDPDLQLYSGGFFNDSDRRMMDQVRETSPEQLASLRLPFQDGRLAEMLWRYRARNYPATLSPGEVTEWMRFCLERLQQGSHGALGLADLRARLDALRTEVGDDRSQHILDELADYADQLEQYLGAGADQLS